MPAISPAQVPVGAHLISEREGGAGGEEEGVKEEEKEREEGKEKERGKGEEGEKRKD